MLVFFIKDVIKDVVFVLFWGLVLLLVSIYEGKMVVFIKIK